jgi:cobalt-zinc-cadmium efflux system membrane fusion protein
MKNSKHITYIFILTAILAGCKRETVETATEAHQDEQNVVELSKDQMETVGIQMGAVEQKQISGTIKVNGILDVPPQQLVSISAPLGGFLKNTNMLQGSRVKKGQLVATIQNIDFIQIQQDYIEAKSNFDLAKIEYERQQELARENVNSQKALQQANTNYLNWQARYGGLQEKLKVLNINASNVERGVLTSSIGLYSPINGYVTQIPVNIGKFVNPADVIMEIVDPEHLHAELIVFEKDVPRLKIGQKVRFTLANESTERMATVYLIGREINANRTVQIHCHIDKEDQNLLPGMYLNALVETGGAAVDALPDAAVIDFQGKKNLFVLSAQGTGAASENTHFEMVPIETGNSELGFTEVKLPNDFDKNSKVVVAGGYALLSKLENTEVADH